MSTLFPGRVFPVRLGATALLLSCAAVACDREAMSDSAPSKKGPQYGVEYVPGGIDRVVLTKRDDARNLCIQVTLASPGIGDGVSGAVDLPPNWTVERAFAVRDASACGSRLLRSAADTIEATSVAGSVRWGNSPTEGTVVDLRLSFPTRGTVPAVTERLSFRR